MARKFFIGVDIGGTFTDLVLAEDGLDRLHNVKTLTTPSDPVQGVMTAVRQALEEVGGRPQDVVRLVHATTLPTNLVLERKGARVAFVTTAGFGDIFQISKQRPVGPDQFNLLYDRPAPLVPRDRVAEIVERMDYQGNVVVPLDGAQAEASLRALAETRPEAVAVCLLHSYANPAHEKAVGRLIAQVMPDAYVSLSSEVWPEYLEYERASTTVLSAYVGPTMAAYVGRLEAALKELGVTSPLQIMQSSGGIMTAASAARKAAYVIESGPAAGVIASAYLGVRSDAPNLISFDMGGTTAKAGVVHHGQPRISNEFRVGGTMSSGARESGEPIRIPVIDLAEVGAGGGSIAWVDKGGFLQVGPHSASADPGPACYGFGGTEPTVTDANLTLGYLDPGYFLGGRMTIHPELSRAALARVGEPLGLDAVQMARGIYELANTHMGSAIRIVTLQRGIDPREHAITAMGGAGPLHVVKVAEQFEIPMVLVPPSPGVKSAFGLLVSDLAYDYVRTCIMPPSAPDIGELERVLVEMEANARAELTREGLAGIDLTVERALDIRFASQVMDITVPVGDGPLSPAAIAKAEADFREAYFDTCGMRPTDPCQVVNARLKVVSTVAKPAIPEVPTGDGNPERARKGTRPAYFAEAHEGRGGFVETPVYDRPRLQPGDRLTGPALLEEPDSTTVCPPGYTVRVDGHLNLLITRS